jgi:hypothetical protein
VAGAATPRRPSFDEIVPAESDKSAASDLRGTKARLQHPSRRVASELWQVWYFGTSVSSVASTRRQSPRIDCQFSTLKSLADIAEQSCNGR